MTTFIALCRYWPDWAKFRHFGKLLKIFAYFSRVYIFAKMINLQLQIFRAAFEQIFVAEFANIEHIV